MAASIEMPYCDVFSQDLRIGRIVGRRNWGASSPLPDSGPPDRKVKSLASLTWIGLLSSDTLKKGGCIDVEGTARLPTYGLARRRYGSGAQPAHRYADPRRRQSDKGYAWFWPRRGNRA